MSSNICMFLYLLYIKIPTYPKSDTIGFQFMIKNNIR